MLVTIMKRAWGFIVYLGEVIIASHSGSYILAYYNIVSCYIV